MKLPLTNTQEVLYTLIKKGSVSIFDYPYLSGFRTRVSDLKLKYNLSIETIKAQRTNKFGNVYTYAIHKLKDKEHAKEVYKSLTVNN